MTPATQRRLSIAEAELLKALRTLQMPGATPDSLARTRIRMARAHIEAATGGLDALAEAPAPELVRERDDFGFPAPVDDGCQLAPGERRSRELSRGAAR